MKIIFEPCSLTLEIGTDVDRQGPVIKISKFMKHVEKVSFEHISVIF